MNFFSSLYRYVHKVKYISPPAAVSSQHHRTETPDSESHLRCVNTRQLRPSVLQNRFYLNMSACVCLVNKGESTGVKIILFSFSNLPADVEICLSEIRLLG